MSDYFDRLEHELRLATVRQAAPVARRSRVIPRLRSDGLVVAFSLGVAALIAVIALSLLHSSRRTSGPAHRSRPDLSVQKHVGPTLADLRANLAVLRQKGTAADRAAISRYVVGTNGRDEVPEFVRRAGIAAGVPVYFVVYPIFEHGSSGPVVAHQMAVMASGGNPYSPGNYLIFPVTVGGFGHPAAYLGVVPDGVRSVRWQFTCLSGPAGCRLPPQRVATVPVRNNLAVLPTPSLPTGSNYAVVSRVTWYRTDGSRTTFTNANRAVPFRGAPAWPSLPRRHRG